MIYGAASRGARGVVAIEQSSVRGCHSKVGDVGFTSETSNGAPISYGGESLTENGDGGALYLETAGGSPVAMRHCLQNLDPNLGCARVYFIRDPSCENLVHPPWGSLKPCDSGTATFLPFCFLQATEPRHCNLQSQAFYKDSTICRAPHGAARESQHRKVQDPPYLP